MNEIMKASGGGGSGQRPKAADLFCGCGGISVGLRDAGFGVIAGADVEPKYICTFRRNFPEAQAVTENLASLGPENFMRRLRIEPQQLDMLAGGPPCQGFSKNVPRKNRFLDLANNRLVLTFIEYVEALKPRLVLMENVAEMKNGFEQSYTDEIVSRLEGDGYHVSYDVLNAADYGVPQRRRRAFFIAYRGGTRLSFPKPTHSKPDDNAPPFLPCVEERNHVTVWEAIGDLPSVNHEDTREVFQYASEPFSDYQDLIRRDSLLVTNHSPRTLARTQFERLACLDPGEGIKQLPPHLRPKSGYSGAYGRLTKGMVSPTITRWVFHPGSGRFGHPVDVRVITIREAARFQGFPDNFEFIGTYTQQAGQVGNAAPPVLIEAITRAMMRQSGYGTAGSAEASKSMKSSIESRSFSDGSRNVML